MDSMTISKKSRAKSCTSCRQVKLKCDMRETYPAPCTRCRDRKQDCRMDSSFQRIGKRRQAEASKDLPSKTQNAPTFQIDAQNPFTGTVSHVTHTQPPQDSYSDEKWLDLEPQPSDTTQSWTIGDVGIEYGIAREIFQQFEEFYLPHLPILEPVSSLNELYSASPFLFWGIIFNGSHFHPRHSALYARLHEPYRNLFGLYMTRQIHLLKDLQALLIICHWPFNVESQQEDPSWIHCGVAVNTALYMGMNRLEDEAMFDARRAEQSLLVSNHLQASVPPLNKGMHIVRPKQKYRRMTWMKCFQISTQLSTWYGLQYSPPGLQEISRFYDDESIPGEFIAMTEIQRQVARYTSSLDGQATDGLVISLAPHLIYDLDGIEARHSKTWSSAVDINLQAAKLYLFSICLMTTDHASLKSMKDSDTAVFLHKILQLGHVAALRVINVTEELSASKRFDPPCSSYDSGGCPILAQPKQHFRVAFFACCFLLKYLDCNDASSSADQDAARNALSRLYQTFMRFPSQQQLPRAAAIIEVLGRAIAPGQGKLGTTVRSRMGASLMYNATWTANDLRGRGNEVRKNKTKSTTVAQSIDNPAVFTPPATITDGSYSTSDTMTTPLDFDLNMQAPVSTFEYQFPFGIWNDALFDAQFGMGSNLYTDMSVPLYNLL